jgi:hypothetical protein
MRPLIKAVRSGPILKYFGLQCFVLALLTLGPLAVSLLFDDYHRRTKDNG